MADQALAQGPALTLLANDIDDLAIVSAALQDAVCAIGDIQFEKAARRLTVSFNRFRWEAQGKRGGQRVRSGLQLGGVLGVKGKRLRGDAPKAILSLMAIAFETSDAPAGAIRLAFAGGGELRIDVECIDVVLADVSRPWPTPRRPAHDLAER